jgi:hypothetical protein
MSVISTVPGVTTFVPESDNVAESGEDSEDEWNYYRVEPSVEGKQEATQPVCIDYSSIPFTWRYENMVKIKLFVVIDY